MTHVGGNKDGTITEYARKALSVARDRFGKSEHADFFSVIDKNSDSPGNWLKAGLRQVTVAKFRDAVEKGELIASQAPPIYICHREQVNRALKLHGSPDSIQRALIITCNGVACGRPSEIATLSPDVLLYDESLSCVVAQWPQLKTVKMKLVPFLPGSNRNNCVVHSFGAAFAAGCFRAHIYDPDEMNYFFPALVKAASPTTTITNYFKALAPGGKNATYSPFAVATLPEDCTAAGQRVGSITQMAQKGVSAEFVAVVSGHDFEAVSTLWRYVTAELAMTIPGARVLSGWPAPPYGQLGDPPRAASWSMILDTGGLSPRQVDDLTDLMLNIRDGFSAPSFLRGGRLRSFTLSMSATLVMYYSESLLANEMTTVTAAMRHTLLFQKLAANHQEADVRLKGWGEAITTGFKASNLHITGGGGGTNGGNEALITTLQMISTQLCGFQGTMTSSMSSLTARVDGLQREVISLDGRLVSLSGMFSNRAPRSPTRPAASDLCDDATSVTSSSSSSSAPSSGLTGEDGSGSTTNSGASTLSSSIGGGSSELSTAGALASSGGASASANLKWFNSADNETTIKKMRAADYFEKVVMGRRPQLSASDKARGAFVEAAFKAVATQAELRVLASKVPEVEVTKTIKVLHDKVIARHIYAYTNAGLPVPNTLQTWKELTINSLTDRTSELDHTLKGKNFKSRFVLEMSVEELEGLPKKEEEIKRKPKAKQTNSPKRAKTTSGPSSG